MGIRQDLQSRHNYFVHARKSLGLVKENKILPKQKQLLCVFKEHAITTHTENLKHLAAAVLAHTVFGEGRGCFGMHTLHSTTAEGIGETQAPQKTQFLFCWARLGADASVLHKVAWSCIQSAQVQILHTTGA